MWKFDTNKWSTPVASWNMVGCNQNGGVTRTVGVTTSSSEELTSETSIEIGVEVEAGGIFGGVTMSSTVSTSISKSWSSSYEESTEFETDCAFYDDGSAWKGGCMW